MSEENIDKYNWHKDLKDTLSSVEIPHNIFWDLLSEVTDDWSFMIKLGSVIEVVLQKYLSKSLPEGMEATIDEFGFAKKLELAKDFKIIISEQYELFKWIKNQRNAAAHNFDYSFENYLNELSKKGYKDNQELFYKLFKDTFSEDWYAKFGLKLSDQKKFILENPKVTVFFASLQPLALIHTDYEHKEFIKKHNGFKEKHEYFMKTIGDMFSSWVKK